MFSILFYKESSFDSWKLGNGFWLAIGAFPLSYFLAFVHRSTFLALTRVDDLNYVPAHPADRSYLDLMRGEHTALLAENDQPPPYWAASPTSAAAPPRPFSSSAC
jgi:hypothetical protein